MAPLLTDEKPGADILTKELPVRASKPAANGTTTNGAYHPSLPNPSLQVTADHQLKLVEAPVYSPKEGEALVHIKATGVCGSDIHFWKSGRIGSLVVEDNCILGHEAAGIVLQCGPGVTNVKPGDRVAVEPGVPCNDCFLCQEGRYNLCEDVQFAGVYPYHGTLQRYKVHPAKWLHKLPDNMTYAEGALLEPLSVVLQGLRVAQLRLGRGVVVCGAGPIGLIALAAARASGAHPIVITDVEARRLAFAKQFVPSCATYQVSPDLGPEDNAKRIRQLFGPDEYAAPPVVLECTGVESSICTAAFTTRRGGTIVVIGVGKAIINNLPFMHLSLAEIELKFINRYRDTWPAGIACLSGGILDLKPLVTHEFPLEQAMEALQLSADLRNGSIKVQVAQQSGSGQTVQGGAGKAGALSSALPLRGDGTASADSPGQLLHSQVTSPAAGGRHRPPDAEEIDQTGPLGLSVVYTPPDAHKADIIFVHGLGGTSRLTWSKNKSPELFWPGRFLPSEPDICQARILTFGYNATFGRRGNVSTSVLDFAKDLLFELKYAKDEDTKDLQIGQVPLIFVVHSMGGLIVKEAYLQGQNDPEYESIVKAISAIVFLATPHRGTDLAHRLNRILQSTMITNPKQYIADLARNSFALQKLNEQFRHIAPKLDLVSFYETQPTSIGLVGAKLMILEKDSSVLGYPGEISKALDADHHGVCKYENRDDPNYIAVRNVLTSVLSKAIARDRSKKPSTRTRSELRDLKAALAMTELPVIDYTFFHDQWARGTSSWILQHPSFLEWLHGEESTHRLLWLSGGAATGKSVMSSFVINTLVERGARCQYFFLRYGDKKKRTLGFLLRSIAYQIALSAPVFLERLTEVLDETISWETADPRIIWDHLFRSALFDIEEQEPLFWVIDGLDEAEDPRAIIKLLTDVYSSSTPIRIFLTSRKTSEIDTAFQKIPAGLAGESISIDGHLEDMRLFVRQELTVSGNKEFTESIVQRLLEGAQNNFLWLRLAVDKVNLCHTHADIEFALKELPAGMEALYHRMASSIAQNPSAPDRQLATAILQCALCSLRPLTVAELSQALGEDAAELMDLQRSVLDLCGGFLTVDNSGNVTLVHQTAREYLLADSESPVHVDRGSAHDYLFLSCMRCLMTIGLRAKVNRNQKPDLLSYPAVHWPEHLASTSLNSKRTTESLLHFLSGHWVLTWMHILAAGKQLEVLIHASKCLSSYSSRRQSTTVPSEEGQHKLFDNWPTDFAQIVTRFGAHLLRDPEAIYKLIPPFCPRNSSIFQLFGKKEKALTVSGPSIENWDELVARIPLGLTNFASSIEAAGKQLAILNSSGSVSLYDSHNYGEKVGSPLQHGERVYMFRLNRTATLLATYGYHTIKIWDISTGECTSSVPNLDSRPRPLAMLFARNDRTLLIGSEDRRLRSLDLTQSMPNLEIVAEFDETELEGCFLNSSSYMALDREGSLIAVAYRGHPLSAWETDGPSHIGHCWRTREAVAIGEVIQAAWHPHSPELIGLYLDGTVFKWNPYSGETAETWARASRMATSGDGNLIVTGDARGTVKVLTLSSFSLIYLRSSQDPVLGVAFSPDMRRFYDLRGYYANAWEPMALVTYTGQTGEPVGSNESEVKNLTQISRTSLGFTQMVDSITILAASPLGRLYCCGSARGVVQLCDIRTGQPAVLHVSKGNLGIEQMSWSSDGRYIVFSDLTKRVFVVAARPGAHVSDPPVTETVAEVPLKNITEGPLLQLLCEPNTRHILISTISTIHTISWTTQATHSRQLGTDKLSWIIHPRDSTLIIGFGLGTIRVLDWNLTEHHTSSFEYAKNNMSTEDPKASRTPDTLDRVLVTHDRLRILVQISLQGRGSDEKVLLYFKTSSFPTSKSPPSSVDQHVVPAAVISPTVLPKEKTSQIALPLSIISRNRLVFVSKFFSVRLWQIPCRPGPKKRRPNGIAPGTSARPTADNDSGESDNAQESTTDIFLLPADWAELYSERNRFFGDGFGPPDPRLHHRMGQRKQPYRRHGGPDDTPRRDGVSGSQLDGRTCAITALAPAISTIHATHALVENPADPRKGQKNKKETDDSR
ncbi:hypothetical protein VTK73DRAFT_7574 [Phialemonium thermophilum]|uniref:Enoyl reductase (ER) domain-containing protein n=1 Tax=Phialemonium thermophilum TaxID=223376 RepID=A0ABR3WDI2_9PEZI